MRRPACSAGALIRTWIARAITRRPAARGVSLWEDSERHQMPLRCLRRVFTGTLDARLLALDADTGLPCVGFGDKGEVNLAAGIHIRDGGAYLVTSPPAIYGNLVIVGSAIGDNRAVSVERGVIRAFDARSGALVWAFDPLPDSPAASGGGRLAAGAGPQRRRRQRLGRDERGRGARPGAGPHRIGQPGLLRRAARRARIASPTRCWRWRPAPARSPGSSSWCTTTCGTTISPRSRCSATSRWVGRRCRR